MTTDWTTEDLPLLRALVDADRASERGDLPPLGDTAVAAGLDQQLAMKVADRLHDGGYLDAAVMRDGAGRLYAVHIRRLLPAGRRAAGQWPSEDPYTALLELLEHSIHDEPDAERRGKLERIRDALQDGGKSVLSNVLANLIVVGGGAALG